MRDGHRRRVATSLIGASLGTAALLSAASGAGAGDLVKGRQNLPEITLGDTNGNDFAVSNKDITMEGGKSYRIDLTSNGGKEYKFMAPEFFRNVWLNQIVINHLEIHPYGPPHHLEFDDAGTISVEFVPIRTGTYEWWIDGLKDKGMFGTLTVK